nr:hypothetical protein [Tanacetum cinerariifolium]
MNPRCGGAAVMSINHKKYCLVVTDDFSRALVTKTHNKTPYELLNGRSPRLDFIRPFRCPITILRDFWLGTLSLVKLLGYLILKPEKLKRIYMLVFTGNQTDKNTSPQDTNGNADDKPADDKPKDDTGFKTIEEPVNKEDQAYRDELERLMSQENNPVNAASTLGTFNAGGPSSPHPDAFILANTLLHVNQDNSQIPDLEETAKLQSTGIFNSAYDDDLDIYTSLVQSVGAEIDFNNMESSTIISPIPTHREHLDHPKDQILGDPKSTLQTRRMAKKSSGAHALVSYIHKQRRTTHKDYENCLFACFLSHMEPKKVSQALDDKSWVKAMLEELLRLSL